MTGPLRVAVVGAGPAGIYAAAALLGAGVPVGIDVFDALPAPFGLVRYGVAPDHPKIKSVTAAFARVLGSPQARFFGNVRYGTDLGAADLRRHYHAVVHATGAPDERRLGILGDDLTGSFAAADFVAWYNGHPGAVDRGYLEAREVVVVGAGNVALDVARMLVTDAATLISSDAPQHVLDAWRSARATDVYILARRGPAFARFTTPELRELGELSGVDLVVDPDDLELDSVSEAVVATDRTAQRNLELLRTWAERPYIRQPRRIHFRFWSRPVRLLGSTRVEAVLVEQTTLLDDGRLVPAPSPASRLPAGAVVRAVGYAGRPQPELPFDPRTATVPNVDGRVVGPGIAGVYVAGWIKRGPSGVIGTNKSDAADTVRTLLTDAPRLPAPAEPDPDAMTALLASRGVRYLNWEQWQAVDEHEVAEGRRARRPRLKVCTVEEMLRIGETGVQAAPKS